MLNLRLYKHLMSKFSGAVRVSKENSPMVYHVLNDVVYKADGGEEYMMCCPCCGDRKFRLYINHRYGTTEETTGKRFERLVNRETGKPLGLMVCFNEGCDLTKLKEFLDLPDYFLGGSLPVAPDFQPSEVQEKHGPPPSPGRCIRLDRLDAGHPAVLFIKERKYDPGDLGRKYGLSYCVASKFPQARGRLIIPIIEDGEAVGWQARYLGKIPDRELLASSLVSGVVTDVVGTGSGIIVSVSGTEHAYPNGVYPVVRKGAEVGAGAVLVKPVEKYWTAPGTPRNRVLYNIDAAKRYDIVVVVEGPFDVMRLGEPSVALLGTKMSYGQQLKIRQHWGNPAFEQIVLMFDSEKAAIEDMERARDSLMADSGRVLTVTLPPGTDPGDHERDILWDMIERARRTA